MNIENIFVIVKKIVPIVAGALIGFGYWYFIGCISGNCPIASSWHTSTLYGALVGATFLIPSKKRKKKRDIETQHSDTTTHKQ